MGRHSYMKIWLTHRNRIIFWGVFILRHFQREHATSRGRNSPNFRWKQGAEVYSWWILGLRSAKWRLRERAFWLVLKRWNHDRGRKPSAFLWEWNLWRGGSGQSRKRPFYSNARTGCVASLWRTNIQRQVLGKWNGRGSQSRWEWKGLCILSVQKRLFCASCHRRGFK